MPFIDAVKYKIGRELVEKVHFGVSAGARNSINAYRQQKLANPGQALYHIRRAVDMPNRTRYKINELRDYLIASTESDLAGVIDNATANTFMVECLAYNAVVTGAELNAQLAGHETYATTLASNIAANISNLVAFNALDSGLLVQTDWDYLDTVADNLEAHYSSDIVRLWNFQINQAAYVNIFGVTGEF